jgi:uncharacterized membrane protein YsdA (DUF1294 family)
MSYGLTFLLLAAATGLALWYGLQWPFWLAWLVAINGVAFIAYRFDKWKAPRARGGRDRVPERVLHLLALAGGSLGALLGMNVPPRHKTSDRRFQIYFWLIVLAQAIVVIWIWST